MRIILLLLAVSLLTACASTRDTASITRSSLSNYTSATDQIERVHRSSRGRYVDVIWVNLPVKRQVAASGDTP